MASLWAIDTGSFSLYVMKNGVPLKNQQVIVFEKIIQQTANVTGYKTKQIEFLTDSDGYLSAVLPEGSYQMQLIAKESGKAQAFVKKNFVIKKNKESQIIVSLKEDNTVAFEDVEAPEQLQKDANQTKTEASNGTVLLSITSSEDKKPIKMARVFVRGMSIDLKTDEKGFVSLTLPSGEQVISVIHSDFSAQTLKVSVLAKESVNKYIEMSPASMELDEFVVLAPHIEGSVASSIDEVRNSSAVEDVLGSEQFSRSGDSDAAGALKRASGLTLVGGKYVYIRGLGDRYSSSLLNGMELPSPEPTKRVVPLDMFPTSVVKSISVQKSYSADLPGNFGGGNIDIRSIDTPETFFGKISIEGKYNSNATFKRENMAQGTSSDITGYDQFRGLTQSTLDKADNLNYNITDADAAIKADLIKNAASFEEARIQPGYKLSASVGDSYALSNGQKFGYVLSYSYDNDWESFDQQRGSIGGGVGSFTAPTDYDTKNIVSHDIKHGGLLGFTYDINDQHKIKQTNLYINHASDVSSFFDTSNEDGNRINEYYLSWVERSLMLNQLEGNHEFLGLGNLRFNWAGEYGSSRRFEPLTKDYTFVEDSGPLAITPQYSMNYVSSELEDSLINARANVEYPFYLLDDTALESNIEFGMYLLSKERDSKTRRFATKINRADADAAGVDRTGDIDSIFNTGNMDLFSLGTTFKAADFYKGYHDITATYGRLDLKPMKELEFVVGLRKEDSQQQVDTYDVSRNPVSYVIETNNLLPELIGTYHINDDMQLRASYAQTVTRPDFREFAPTRYQDPLTGDIIFGNENLTYSEITHFDTRFEWYMSAKETFSVGAFYKTFVNPIETVKTKDDTPTFTYINADSADLYGLELAFRKELGFATSYLDNFYFGGNLAYMASTITLSDSIVNLYGLTTREREMQGQSPYVLNLQLGYENEGRIVTLLYNSIGERIVSLGTEGDPDIYEQPFHQLDLVYSEELSASTMLQFKIQNILDDSVDWTQEGYVIRTHKKGMDITAKLEYKF